MVKMDWGMIAALGIAGIMAYVIFKNFTGSAAADGGTGGGGGYSSTTTTETRIITIPGGGSTQPTTVPVPNIPPPSGGFKPYTEAQILDIHAAAGQRQTWKGGTYGAPGQPSETFKKKIVSGKSSMAKAAINAGAPPRIVAKIKAGKVF